MKKSRINRKAKHFAVPRVIAIISLRLDMTFQPNKGSSFYKRPPKDKVPVFQRSWDSPVGTLRLSDHWNYRNSYEELVYRTNNTVPQNKWVLCVNTGIPPRAWKVLQIFRKDENNNVIMSIDFNKITDEINALLC